MNAVELQIESPFYVTGGTLSRDALCYVTRRADDDLYAGLKRRQFCYLLTSRQMGKSSLMVRTASRLRDEGIGVVVLDLTAVGTNLTAEQWYSGLLAQTGQQLELDDELEEFWDSHPKLGPLQRWMQAIRQVLLNSYPGRVVIFIDEIDAVRSLPFSTDEFFAAIREFYNRRSEDEELEELARLEEGEAAVHGVAFSPDGKLLASVSAAGSIKLWDVATQRWLATLNRNASDLDGVLFSPDSKRLATTSAEGAIKLWDVDTRKETLTLKGHAGLVFAPAFSPDGKRLVTGGQDFTVRLWDVATGQELATFRRHTGPVWSVTFSPDGKTLVSAGRDGILRVWRAATEDEVRARGGQ